MGARQNAQALSRLEVTHANNAASLLRLTGVTIKSEMHKTFTEFQN